MVCCNFLSTSNVTQPTQVISDFCYAIEISRLAAKILGFSGLFDPFRTYVINGTSKRYFLHGKHAFSAIIDLYAPLRSVCARA